MYVGSFLLKIDTPLRTLAIGFLLSSVTAMAETESRIKLLTLNAGASVTPNCRIFLKSLATSRNLDFGPKYPIAEIASNSKGSLILKYCACPSTMIFADPVFSVVGSTTGVSPNLKRDADCMVDTAAWFFMAAERM